MSLELDPESAFNPTTSTTLKFTLKGDANFVWVFDANRLKSDILGLSINDAMAIIASNNSIKEAKIEPKPFWNRSVPDNPDDVKITDTISK